jgi:hypothetical protein
MAKVKFSALVESMSGKLNGSTASSWKGVNILKRTARPRQPRSESQQLVRGIMNNLSGQWYSLSSDTKSLWNRFASLLTKPMSGMNAYIKQNSALVRYLGYGSELSTPPPSPSTPESIYGLSLAVTNSTTNAISWTTPVTAADYVIVEYSFLTGRDDSASPRWTFAAGGSASAASVNHTHSFPVGTVMRYRARVMDSYGRMSPSTATSSIMTTE